MSPDFAAKLGKWKSTPLIPTVFSLSLSVNSNAIRFMIMKKKRKLEMNQSFNVRDLDAIRNSKRATHTQKRNGQIRWMATHPSNYDLDFKDDSQCLVLTLFNHAVKKFSTTFGQRRIDQTTNPRSLINRFSIGCWWCIWKTTWSTTDWLILWLILFNVSFVIYKRLINWFLYSNHVIKCGEPCEEFHYASDPIKMALVRLNSIRHVLLMNWLIGF